MADDAAQRAMDAQEHKKNYDSVMKVGTQFGVPFLLSLTMFFTQLTMGHGLWSVFWFVVTYLFSWYVVKTFFSAH
ncbi:MAG: hypothetical protein KDA46_09070 [Parvularculaceae bacterium]|nr:hypothetical protein [Parvularculaceae bacterium]